MLIEIDTREQKTPTHIERLIELYTIKHPQLAKDMKIEVKTLDCDIRIEDHYCAEIKWGHDLVSSLNSKHFLKQLTGMRESMSPDFQLYLLVANTSTYHITTVELARATTICQELNVIVLYANDPLDVLEKFIDIARISHEVHLLPKEVIVEGNKKAPELVRMFSQIDGVSQEFAFFFIKPEWKTMEEVMMYIDTGWTLSEKLEEYYHRNMQKLKDHIIEVLFR